MRIVSLKRRAHALSDPARQIDLLTAVELQGVCSFEEKLLEMGVATLRPTAIDILQINVGYMCNQTCKHCHVDAGPDRREIMTKETMQQCLDVVANNPVKTVDITGGAPEMNPNFRWFVQALSELGVHIIVRCNLTIIEANKKYSDLPEFFKQYGVEVISSLPYFAANRTDAQRGKGVFDRSIAALKKLNAVGYGIMPGLELNLVYNPSGAFLPADQSELEQQFKQKLRDRWNIEFNKLFTITNLPVSRFLEFLVANNKYEEYMQELAVAFNPAAVNGLMCRNTISVGWDGELYDCDFNQMLGLKVSENAPQKISEFEWSSLLERKIQLGNHCFGCTAGAGSSCTGATT